MINHGHSLYCSVYLWDLLEIFSIKMTLTIVIYISSLLAFLNDSIPSFPHQCFTLLNAGTFPDNSFW